MRLYSDLGARRALQIVGDAVALAVLVVAVLLARTLHALIVEFADLGRRVEAGGDGLARNLTDIGDRLAGVPLIGGAIASPFESASGAGDAIAEAGRGQQEVVAQLAAVTAWTVVLGALALVVVAWVLPRARGVLRAARVRRSIEGEGGRGVLALRALLTAPTEALLAIDAAPADAWRRGDPRVIDGLAALEARRRGVRLR